MGTQCPIVSFHVSVELLPYQNQPHEPISAYSDLLRFYQRSYLIFGDSHWPNVRSGTRKRAGIRRFQRKLGWSFRQSERPMNRHYCLVKPLECHSHIVWNLKRFFDFAQDDKKRVWSSFAKAMEDERKNGVSPPLPPFWRNAIRLNQDLWGVTPYSGRVGINYPRAYLAWGKRKKLCHLLRRQKMATKDDAWLRWSENHQLTH